MLNMRIKTHNWLQEASSSRKSLHYLFVSFNISPGTSEGLTFSLHQPQSSFWRLVRILVPGLAAGLAIANCKKNKEEVRILESCIAFWCSIFYFRMPKQNPNSGLSNPLYFHRVAETF